jgi:hypothetical protein
MTDCSSFSPPHFRHNGFIDFMNRFIILSMLAALAIARPLAAAEKEMMILGEHTNGVLISVKTNVTQDPATNLYDYSYTLISSTASIKPLAVFALELGKVRPPTLQNIRQPSGWSHRICSVGPTKFCWEKNELDESHPLVRGGTGCVGSDAHKFTNGLQM